MAIVQLIGFDSWLDRIPQKNRREFVHTYAEAAKSWDSPVAITCKQNDLLVLGLAGARKVVIGGYAWLTDDTSSAGAWTETGSGHI